MLHKTLTAAIFFIVTIGLNVDCKSQNQFEPSVIVLTPDRVKKDTSLIPEIQEQEKKTKDLRKNLIKKRKKQLQKKNHKGENFKVINKKFIKFYKEMSFYANISSLTARYLLYALYNKLPNSLIYPINEKSSGSKELLVQLANKHSARYILNFPKVKSYLIEKSKYTDITIQLYDNKKEEFVLDTIITGKNENPHYAFTCESEGISCTFNNALSKILPRIAKIILINNKSIQQKQQLAKQRSKRLLSEYYSNPAPKEIPQIIQNNDSTIPTTEYYQGLMSSSNRKFIGFFADNPDVNNLRELRNNRNDNNIKVNLSKNSKDTIPMYAYIVVGVKPDTQWYIKQKKVTYFNSPSFEIGKKRYFKKLREWGYFKDNSLEVNPDFWETNFFAKVKDLRKHPDWDKYGDNIWKQREKENRPYIGQYKIVAEIKKRRKKKMEEQKRKKTEEEIEEEKNEKFRNKMKKEVFIPLYDSLVKLKYNNYKTYKLIEEERLTLLYPPSKDKILSIVAFTNSKNEIFLDYFYFNRSKGKLYKWEYFQPKKIEQPKKMVIPSYYGKQVVKLISKLTEWDYTKMYLDDQKFWNDYVSKRMDGEYKYLNSID